MAFMRPTRQCHWRSRRRLVDDRRAVASCGLTFELSRPWRQTPAGRARTICTMAWSGQTVAAVAGRRLERGVRAHSH